MKNFSPNLVILVIVLILVSASIAIYFKQQNKQVAVLTPQTPEVNRSIPPTLDVDIESPASTAAKTKTPAPSFAPLSVYIYPQAKIISQTLGKLELESSADSIAVTDWYKDKIRQSGFNAKSFSQTNTNGVVFNKLSAAKPGEKIEVTIKKDQNASIVTITVDRP